MELQAVIGELYLLDGVVQTPAAVPGLLVQPAPKKTARGRDRDYLFVHLTLTGRPEEYAEAAQTMLAQIRETYFQSTGSITAALRKAILAANQWLLRTNLTKGAATRQGAIMCAVLREQELFMVQSGEAFALIARDFGVERQWRLRRAGVRPRDGATILIHEATVSDRVEQVQHIWLRYEVFQQGQLAQTQLRTHILRWYHKHEFTMMLESVGFRHITVQCGYADRDAANPEAELIFIAKR